MIRGPTMALAITENAFAHDKKVDGNQVASTAVNDKWTATNDALAVRIGST